MDWRVVQYLPVQLPCTRSFVCSLHSLKYSLTRLRCNFTRWDCDGEYGFCSIILYYLIMLPVLIFPEAKSVVSRAASVFVLNLASYSTDHAHGKKRRMVTAEDVIASLKQLDCERLEQKVDSYLSNSRLQELSFEYIRAILQLLRVKRDMRETRSF